MAAVQALCTKGVFLERGRLKYIGDVDEVVKHYIKAGGHGRLSEAREVGTDFELMKIEAGTPDGSPLETFQPARVAVTFRPLRAITDASVHIVIEDLNGTPVIGLDSKDLLEKRSARANEPLTMVFNIASLPLTPGPFRMRVWLKSQDEGIFWGIQKGFDFTVEGGAIYGSRTIDRQWHGTTGARVKVELVGAEA
jgi:hypothetical protein